MSDIDNANPSAQWSEVDASNTAPAPDGFPQAGSPAQDLWIDVPANGRALMGALKRFWDRINGTITTTGSAGAYVYTPSNTAFPTAYIQGETYTFKANFTNVGGDTLNVKALGALPLYKPSAGGLIPLAAGDIQSGQIISAIYDGTLNAGSGGFQVAGASASTGQAASSARGLTGSAPGATKTASWRVQVLVAESTLGGAVYSGANLSLTFNGATTGAGGMDTGSMPTSGDLSVYAIYNPGTNTWNTLGCLGSTSNGPVYTGSNMPSGYVASTLIWVGRTDSTPNVRRFSQIDRIAYYPPFIEASDLSASTYTLVAVGSGYVPAAANRVQVTALLGPAGLDNLLIAADPSGTGQIVAWGSNSALTTPGWVPLLTAQTLYYTTTQGESWSLISSAYAF